MLSDMRKPDSRMNRRSLLVSFCVMKKMPDNNDRSAGIVYRASVKFEMKYSNSKYSNSMNIPNRNTENANVIKPKFLGISFFRKKEIPTQTSATPRRIVKKS